MRLKKQSRIIILCAGAAVLLTAAVVCFAVILGRDSISAALKPGKFDKVQLLIAETLLSDSADHEAEEPESGAGEDSESTSAGAESEYEPEETEVCRIVWDGDLVYEEGYAGNRRQYFYSRGGKPYVLFYDTMAGILEEGRWTEYLAESFNYSKPFFDISSIAKLSDLNLQKIESGLYAPSPGGEQDLFGMFFGIGESGMEKYLVYDIKLSVKQGRLTKITAAFVYNGTQDIRQELTFSYDDEKLTLPETAE